MAKWVGIRGGPPIETWRVVDLEALTYSYGKWQLCGIPCIHACAAIYKRRYRPDDYVSKWYRIVTYLKSYKYVIHAMLGSEDWPEDPTHDMILPPIVRI